MELRGKSVKIIWWQSQSAKRWMKKTNKNLKNEEAVIDGGQEIHSKIELIQLWQSENQKVNIKKINM